MSDETLYNSKIEYSFVPLPKVWRFLSYYDNEGKRTRLTPNDICVLAYYMELSENFKSNATAAMECNMKLTAFKASKANLQREMVEIGSPLIYVSHWNAHDGSPRATVEFCASQKSLGALFDELYDKELGEGRRDYWLSFWNPNILEKPNKNYRGQHTTSGFRRARSIYDLGRGQHTTSKETKEKETKKENNNRPPAKEAAPAVVVFPILDELKIPKKLKVKLSSENDEETVCKLVQRVKAWTARGSDAVACNTILAHWETWEDKVPKEDLFHTNRAWAQKALHAFDSPGNKPTVGIYQCAVLSKYVEFTTGTHQPVCFNYDSADFQEQIRLFLNKHGIFL